MGWRGSYKRRFPTFAQAAKEREQAGLVPVVVIPSTGGHVKQHDADCADPKCEQKRERSA